MAKQNLTKTYQYDIAVSLCKQDIEFARKLVKALNPSLKVFFYEDKQEELINQSGPEAFAKVFKEQSRIIVILSRNEWSESFYTEIERNAIIDRTAVKNEGYQFLIVMPMQQGEIPSWYPSTRIYASPTKFEIKDLARFIEFKLADEGGLIKPITLEERYQNLLNRIEEKKTLVRLQEAPIAIEYARNELENVKKSFNQKIEFFRNNIFATSSWKQFNGSVNNANLGLDDFILQCKAISSDEMYGPLVSTQDFYISFELIQVSKDEQTRKTIESEERVFYYSDELKGWALPIVYENPTIKEYPVLFRNRGSQNYYDLKSPTDIIILHDFWLHKLLSKSSRKIERYL